MRLAIFDLDGTVLRVNSWHVFVRWLIVKKPARALRFSWGLARRFVGLIDGRGLREIALRELRGMHRGSLSELGEEVVSAYLRRHIRPAGLSEMARNGESGYTPVLATGAFEFIAEPLAREMGVGVVVATRMEYDADGRFTGRIWGDECRGFAKAKAVRDAFAKTDVDWRGSQAFSDDMEDAPLFALVGRGVLVGPRFRGIPGPGLDVVDWD